MNPIQGLILALYFVPVKKKIYFPAVRDTSCGPSRDPGLRDWLRPGSYKAKTVPKLADGGIKTKINGFLWRKS
jgi:hypothetical protein